MKKVVLLICTLLLWGLSYSQQSTPSKITITGRVIDSLSKQPIEFATISFKNEKELVGTTSDKNGDFNMSIISGVYTIKIEFLSYKPQLFINRDLKNDTRLDTISLSFNVENLDEIEIVAQKDLMEFKVDRKIYHASKDIANKGGNAIDVLNNTPSVRVDDNGNIIMRGSNATILIDGKPLLGLDEDTDILNSIPSNSIEDIEIITRSARYGAEGGGGIINIITKKRKISGLSGSIDAHLGSPDNNGASVFLNKKTGKINIFSTISFNNGVKIKRTTIDQFFIDSFENITGFFEENSKDENQRNSFLFNLGSEFYINGNNTLTASFLINKNNKNFRSNLSLDDFDASNNLIQSANRNVEDLDDMFKLEAFLNYTTKFDNKGHQLSFDFKYDNTSSENDVNIIENVIMPIQEVINQKVIKDQNLDNYLFQLDYTLPFSETKKVELGYKGAFRFYKNDYAIINSFNDIINYDEKVHAFYGQFSAEHGNLSYSLGLRTVISDIFSLSKNTSSNNFSKKYTDVFPSAMLGYEFKNGSYLSANYSKSIERPKISQLNPFISLNDERFQSVGNPELNPFYNNYFELLYDTSFKKLMITSSIYLNYAKDQFLTVIENAGQNTNGFDIFRRTDINSGYKKIIGADMDITYKPFKQLRLGAYIAPYNLDISNTINNQYDFNSWVWYAEGYVLVLLKNGLKFKANHYYQSPITNGLTKLRTINYNSATISKDLFQKNATLTFKVIDIFNSKWFSTQSFEANTNTLRRIKLDQQFNLSFTYRFNQKSRNSKNRNKDVDKDVLEDKQDKKL